jgi:hypothetical protein
LIQRPQGIYGFAALGYLNVNNYHPWCRVALCRESVGPNTAIATGGQSGSEWDAITGSFMRIGFSRRFNLNLLIGRTDTKSGLINYLNKFGYSDGYEHMTM